MPAGTKRPSSKSPTSAFTSLRRYIQDRPLGTCNRNASVKLMRDRLSQSRSLFRKDLHAHYGCVNAIEFSDDGTWLVSGGDDRRVLLWNVESAIHGSGQPTSMKGEHSSNIFCLALDNSNSKIFSAGNDEQVIVHDAHTGESLDVYLHEEAVYGISMDPTNGNVFASACDDGRVLIWDIREPSSTEPFCLASCSSAFHAVMYNPMEPRLLATANSKEGVSLWDVRRPHNWMIKYGSPGSVQSCMSVRFNQSGHRILALRRRLPPVLFDLHSAAHTCQFDHKGYYNSCTMKSCSFAGDDDQYVLSGSDDFNLYMWKIPEESSGRTWVDEAHMVLRGHRSIVNQVRFNTSNFLLASSGVEKIIKLWSPFTIPRSTGTADKERKVYSHMEYINMVMHGGQVMTHDYSQRSTQEDPRMMAFFDSLVQREIEGLVTDDESDDDDESGGGDDSSVRSNANNGDGWLYNLAGTAILSEIESSEDSSSNSDNDVVVVEDATTTHSNTAAAANGGDSSSDGHRSSGGGVTRNTISWLIRRKRQQMVEAARARCMRDLRQSSDRQSPSTADDDEDGTSAGSSPSSSGSSSSSSSSEPIAGGTTIATSPSSSSNGCRAEAGPSSRKTSSSCKRPVRFVNSSSSSSDSGMDDGVVASRRKRPCKVVAATTTTSTAVVSKKEASATSTPDSGIVTVVDKQPQPSSANGAADKSGNGGGERFKRTNRQSRSRRQYRSKAKAATDSNRN